jgi:serine/threonine protein kinase
MKIYFDIKLVKHYNYNYNNMIKKIKPNVHNNIEDTLEITTLINEGAFGKVYNGVSEKYNDKHIAVKIIDTTIFEDHTWEYLYNEINILKRLNSADIYNTCFLQLHYVGIEIDNYMLVTEKINGCDFFDIVYEDTIDINNDILKKFIYNLLNGLNIMHQHDIAHRDIKLENIMYDVKSNEIKIVDMGLSCFTNTIYQHNHNPCTPTYASPELLKHIRIVDDKKNDVWATGISVFIVLAKVCDKIDYALKYQDEDVEKYIDGYENIRSDYLEKTIVRYAAFIDSEYINIVTKMVKTDYSERPSINSMLNFFNNI